MENKIVDFIQSLYQTKSAISLQEPKFNGNEKNYLIDTIDSTFVSSVGAYVNKFEQAICDYTGRKYAIAVVNGTAALHASLSMLELSQGDLIITQALTFVATCNAIKYCGAEPLFIDVNESTYGLCPDKVQKYLGKNAKLNKKSQCVHIESGRRIRALLPMHTLGHCADLDGLLKVCHKWHLTLVEDAAESLGSFYKGKHSGTFGRFSALSFNGNKIITTGGGGIILCQNKTDALKLRHITTTAKQAHSFEYFHDEIGFNYRMPNLNAALGCAQLENLEHKLKKHKQLSNLYQDFFNDTDYKCLNQSDKGSSNYWLNAIFCPSKQAKERLLNKLHEHKILARPMWQLMHNLPMYENCLHDNLKQSIWMYEHAVCLPSTVLSEG